MVNYRCILIDDEKQAVNALKHELEVNCPEMKIIGEAYSVKEAVALIEETHPDVIFLDIQLTDGLGFDVLEQISTYSPKVIFTTAYSEHAIRAFKFNAIDYLLKPIDGVELGQAVRKLLLVENNELKQRLDNLLDNQNASNLNKKIAISTSEGIHLFPLKSILKLNSERNYTRVYFTNGKTLLSAKTLKEFEEILSPYPFMRIHQSYIVNLRHIKSYINKDGGYILMDDESTLPLAARKKSKLLEELKNI